VAALATPPTSPGRRITRNEPERRALLMPYRLWLGPTFLTLAVAMAAANTGCFLRHHWGWVLAAAIYAEEPWTSSARQIPAPSASGWRVSPAFQVRLDTASLSRQSRTKA